jgi:uncharacterized protein (TIGR02118 family)
MAAHLLVLYAPPADPAAFDAYYLGTHVPIAKRMPGLRSYTINKGPIAGGGAASPYYLIATLEFDSMAALGAAAASPEGQAASADVPNFGMAGVTVLTYETTTV